jgi:hypothetical protein
MNDTGLPGAKEHLKLLWIAYFDVIPRHRVQPLLANGPNEVWSWDITKLLGPEKWALFYLSTS